MTKNNPNDSEIIKKMAESRVLVIGDIMLDRYVYGRVDRISPESPVPVLSITRETKMLGGAGNTLSNLAHLNCDASIACLVGQDDEGMEIQNLIAELGIETNGIVVTADRPTIVKTRFLAGHQQLLRSDYEKILPFSKETEKQFQENAISMVLENDVVILSDYGKGLLNPEFIKRLISTANNKNIPVIVDPKGHDYSIYRGATAVTPNKKELSEATGGMAVDTDEEIIAASRKLIEHCGIKAVVATRSKDGMSIIESNSAIHIQSAANIEVFDVSGAGDTVIATLGAAIASGATLTKAAAIANTAGSIVVTKVGTAPIRAEELIEKLQENDTNTDIALFGLENNHSRWTAPVLSWDKAKEQAHRWKARGLKIGFTNGCFDILHKGHVSYLNDARSRCDRLIIGLNSDASVKILKGLQRPIHDEIARASVLAALGCVDMVVLFGANNANEDNTACSLISLLHPDVYFKGGDYTIEQIPEAPAVISVGGLVEIMPSYSGHSTTASIAKINDPCAA